MTSSRTFVQQALFGSADAVQRQRPAQLSRAHPSVAFYYCQRCPLNRQIKVFAHIPSTARIIAVGIAPGAVEEEKGIGFVGPAGQVLRKVIAANGFDPEVDVGYANVTRCRPDDGRFTTPGYKAAVLCCDRYLRADVDVLGSVRGANGAMEYLPLLLLGQVPVEKFLPRQRHSPASVFRERGLWRRTRAGNRLVFSVRHPASILRATPEDAQRELLEQFCLDIARCLAVVRDPKSGIEGVDVTLYENPDQARDFIRALCDHGGPFAFDLEAYDAKECPSRPGIAVDPCHPDFRVRGVAIAPKHNKAAWIELRPWESRKADARKILDPLFANEASKICQNGSYDEDALVYQGWVSRIRNRRHDTMLAQIALGDTDKPRAMKLDTAVLDLLDKPQHWVGSDKSYIRSMPIEEVGTGACYDAARTYELMLVLDTRLRREEYF